MTDFTEQGTIKRREYNARIMAKVAKHIPAIGTTPETLEYQTGLTPDAVKLALNLLHTQDQALFNSGKWFKA